MSVQVLNLLDYIGFQIIGGSCLDGGSAILKKIKIIQKFMSCIRRGKIKTKVHSDI